MNPLNPNLNRRHFMGLVGGSCAVIAAAKIIPFRAAAQSNNGAPPPPFRGRHLPSVAAKTASEGTLTQVSTDVLVVGGGMAGVFAAVKAHDAGTNVLLVDKGSVGRSGQTPFARGIFRFDEKDGMSRSEYLKQTADAAEYMNNPVYTGLLLDQSASVVDELESWGFFKEATYVKALNHPLKERNIPVIERVMLTHLLED